MKLVVGGSSFERDENGKWTQLYSVVERQFFSNVDRQLAAALDRIAELEPLAKFGLAVAKAWRDVHDYADIDGDIIQEAAEDAGLMVDVPAGTHEDCDGCEGGAMPCKELRLP